MSLKVHFQPAVSLKVGPTRTIAPLSAIFLSSIILTSCGGDDYNEGNNTTEFSDVRLVSVSATGDTADIAANIEYKISDPSAVLKVSATNEDSETISVNVGTGDYGDALTLNQGEGSATLEFAITPDPETPTTPIVLQSWLTANTTDSKNAGYAFSTTDYTVGFSTTATRQITNLTGLTIVPIDGSYSVAFNETFQAKEHIFRFRVNDQNGQSVTGLEEAFNQYFSIVENGVSADRESIDSGEEQSDALSTYFVVDASDSIVQAGSTDAVRESVSKTIISLYGLSDFYYRQFATQVRTLSSMRELTYDRTDGFTSLYHAIDLTLDDIAANTNTRQKAMIVFTDGDDNYSQNYPPNLSKNDTYNYLLGRIQTTAANTLGGLAIYTIGLGNGIDETRLTEIAEATQGAFVAASSVEDLNEKFSEIYSLIRSTYTLSYLSPNLGDTSSLVLGIDIDGVTDEYTIVP